MFLKVIFTVLFVSQQIVDAQTRPCINLYTLEGLLPNLIDILTDKKLDVYEIPLTISSGIGEGHCRDGYRRVCPYQENGQLYYPTCEDQLIATHEQLACHGICLADPKAEFFFERCARPNDFENVKPCTDITRSVCYYRGSYNDGPTQYIPCQPLKTEVDGSNLCPFFCCADTCVPRPQV